MSGSTSNAALNCNGWPSSIFRSVTCGCETGCSFCFSTSARKARGMSASTTSLRISSAKRLRTTPAGTLPLRKPGIRASLEYFCTIVSVSRRTSSAGISMESSRWQAFGAGGVLVSGELKWTSSGGGSGCNSTYDYKVEDGRGSNGGAKRYEGNLRRAIETHGRIDQADTATCVELKLADAVQTFGILSRQRGQDQRPDERKLHLASMGVSGELKIDCATRDIVGNVRFVG